jgi:DNA-binding NtrC family response regulator
MNAAEQPRVLVVEDEQETLLSLIRAVKSQVSEAAFDGVSLVPKAHELLANQKPHVVILDLSLEPERGVESGYELLKKIIADDPSCRVIVLTGHGSVEFGVRALRLGAANFLEKPAEISHLAALVRDGISQCQLRRELLASAKRAATSAESILIGESDKMKQVRDAVAYAGSNNQAVLITGETGTGKGLCAMAIHRASLRKEHPFVRYQPTFATADLVNSDLFGHLKGSFTGANEDRAGLIASAARGTLFLDEIEELPLETQVALLGTLQDRLFRPVGSSRELSCDFRLICASNSDVEGDIVAGKLRRDFFHRIAHFRIEMPPLKSRIEDLELLARAAIDQLCARDGFAINEIAREALQAMSQYAWPGNVRELQAVAEGAAYRARFANRTTIELQDLTLGNQASPAVNLNFHDRVERFKLQLISDALKKNNGNQVQAAKELGLDRNSMRRMMNRGS